MARHNDVGNDGESLAAAYLQAHGYRVLDRNWKAPRSRHELDIVAMGDNRLVIVEVKTRSNRTHGEPLDAVDWRKVRALVDATNSYVRVQRIDMPIRFDVIGIVDGEVQHIKNAIVPPANFY